MSRMQNLPFSPHCTDSAGQNLKEELNTKSLLNGHVRRHFLGLASELVRSVGGASTLD